MPSFADSIFIFVLALVIFGPKKLPQLARQLGKLMAEFRRASNEFRMQMEDELRIEEQRQHQQKIDALPGPTSAHDPAIPTEDPVHPHLPRTAPDAEPVIAQSGGLKMMPPATGLPVESSAFDTPEPAAAAEASAAETGIGSSSEEPASESAAPSTPEALPTGEPATHA